MGLDFEGCAFFGACFAKRSAIGKKLDAYIDRAGGTPAETEVAGVEVAEVGSQPTGDTWLVVRAVGSAHYFGRGSTVRPPERLVEESTWRPRLDAFFALAKIAPTAAGWYFAGTVS